MGRHRDVCDNQIAQKGNPTGMLADNYQP